MNSSGYTTQYDQVYNTFLFDSKGPERTIHKAVVFSKVRKGLYNIALGDINSEGELDDESRSDNGDMNKVFATVAQCILDFMNTHPDTDVLVQGNTVAKNRLYRGVINSMWDGIEVELHIDGLVGNEWESFSRGSTKSYLSFIFSKKKH
jgi:hypothetical protein